MKIGRAIIGIKDSSAEARLKRLDQSVLSLRLN